MRARAKAAASGYALYIFEIRARVRMRRPSWPNLVCTLPRLTFLTRICINVSIRITLRQLPAFSIHPMTDCLLDILHDATSLLRFPTPDHPVTMSVPGPLKD